MPYCATFYKNIVMLDGTPNVISDFHCARKQALLEKHGQANSNS